MRLHAAQLLLLSGFAPHPTLHHFVTRSHFLRAIHHLGDKFTTPDAKAIALTVVACTKNTVSQNIMSSNTCNYRQSDVCKQISNLMNNLISVITRFTYNQNPIPPRIPKTSNHHTGWGVLPSAFGFPLKSIYQRDSSFHLRGLCDVSHKT